MVLKDVPDVRLGAVRLNFGGTQTGPANLIPFKTIAVYLSGEHGWLIGILNIMGNIFLLIPVGFLLPFVFSKMNWKKSIIPAICFGFLIEGMQVLLKVGIFDIDDVILNALGVMAGYWCFHVYKTKLKAMPARFVIISAMVITAIVALAAFYSIAFFQKAQSQREDVHFTNDVMADSVSTKNNHEPKKADPCKGTGGTGEIINVGKNSFTLKRRDGLNELIHFTDNTAFSNSGGKISPASLSIGARVTVVVLDDEKGESVASVVLVCNETEQSEAAGLKAKR
jgi:glycopeptide antibiotics resistance protein